MFEFLTRNNTTNEIESYIDFITANIKKLEIHKAAIEKAVNMIGKAIAKSEIVIQSKDKRRYDEEYYRLNIRPNDNETGTDFWMCVVNELLITGECLICRAGGKYYRVCSYCENNEILKGRTYSNIRISLGTSEIKLNKTIKADDMIVLKWKNHKQKIYFEKVVRLMDDTLAALNTMHKMSNVPRFNLKMEAKVRLAEKGGNADGTDKIITKDVYKAKLKALLENDDLTIVETSEGISLEQLKFESTTSVDEILKLSKEIKSEAAEAFDIPQMVYFGNISEKSDATNEFITYAVAPVAEVINDSLNAKLVGIEDYVKGERVFVWLARYKHVDVIDSASSLDKLRAIGFNYDEIRQMVGYDVLNTKFSQARALTKNYATEEEKEGENNNEDT